MTEELPRLVADVLASARHRDADPELVARIGARELEVQKSHRAAVKATKTRLHQAVGAFWLKRPRYDAWLAELRAALASDDALRATCLSIMRRHASTDERIPELDRFYATLFAGLEARSVVDLGCGLNPLALPWMPLPPGARYYACDADGGVAGFVGRWLELAGAGRADRLDLLAGAPHAAGDVALLLKLLPSLEVLDGVAPSRLLASVRAPVLVVSYAAASLGGRVRYRDVIERFARHAGPLADGAEEHRFGNEVVYVVRR